LTKNECPDLQLHADEPITEPDFDALERSRLAGSIAAKVLARDTTSCMVVGISGPWGSGKTSLLNLIEGRIQKEAEQKSGILTLRFNPWSYSTIDQLIVAFFRDLRRTLSPIDKEELVGNIGDALDKLAMLLIPLSMIPGLQPAAAVSVVISPIAKMMKSAAKSKPIEKIKQDLNGYLREAGVHLVIFIDDLDRAEPECVRLMLQLIRMNADFSGTTYVLAFDRDRTARALSTALGETEKDGLDYLGKMIQVPFDLPVMESLRLKVAVADAVNPLFEIIFNEPDLMKRHREMMDAGFYELFDNIRDAKRFANSLAVTMPLVWNEVNPVDFAVLEALRLQYPSLHSKLHRHRWLLLSESRGLKEAVRTAMNQDKPDRKGHKAVYETLLDLASDQRDIVAALLEALFPQLSRLTCDHLAWIWPFNTEWSRNRLVCSIDHFDSYFFLCLGIRRVSENELSVALGLTNDREALGRMLLKLDREGKAQEMLRRIRLRAEDLSPSEIEVSICALLDVSDGFSGWREADQDPTSAAGISFYLTSLTQVIAQSDKNMVILKRSIESGKGLCGVVTFANLVLDMTGKSTVSERHQRELKGLVCKRIEAAAERGDLLECPRPVFVLYRWAEWDRKSANGYIVGLIGTDPGLLQLLQSLQHSGGTYSDSSGYVKPAHGDLARIIGGLIPEHELDQAAARAQTIVDRGTIDGKGVARDLENSETELLTGFAGAVNALSHASEDNGDEE